MPADELGGIQEDDLRAFMATHPNFDDAGTSITARFSRSVAKLVVWRQGVGESPGLAAFLLSESMAADVDGKAVTPSHFLANGNDPIIGSLWLVQAEIKNAYRMDAQATTDATLFSAVQATGFQERPAIFIDARSQPWQLRLYPMGVAFEDFWISVDLTDTPIPESHMRETLDRFWDQGLRTPELAKQSNQPIWKKAADGIPEYRPEQRIQWRLRDTLIGAFPRRKIRAEKRTEEGRGDIFITGDTTAVTGSPAQSTDWVLELKALCDMTSTGVKITDEKAHTEAALSKGVVQAIGYRTSENGVQAALCCYEMRATDEDDSTCFAPVQVKANAHQIRLWRWCLYRSVDDARMARFG